MSKRVLVLGGGVGGLTVATRLRHLLPDSDTVTLVERSETHVLGLSLLWLMRGWRRLDEVTARPSSSHLPGVDIVRASVEEIDTDRRLVVTTNGEHRYDALVIALGAETDLDGATGLASEIERGRAAQFYSPSGAVAANQRLRQVTSGRVAVVVTSIPYRCPGAPWEAAFLADDLLRENGVRGTVEVDVFTPEPQPMPVAGPAVGQALIGMLAERGINVHVGTPIAEFGEGQLVTQDGTRHDVDLSLVVPPHRPAEPVRRWRTGNEMPWIPVNRHTLAIDGIEGAWALGDAAFVALPDGRPLPKAAVFARGQAQAVAAGVASYLGADVPAQPFTGAGYCHLELGGGVAAKGAGDFFAADGPAVTLITPSAALHAEKRHEESDWLARWA
jgi:sulfide:quinone oxidoreductase